MAMKFYSSTLTHHCPKCNTILKKEKHDDTLNFIYFVLFIPIGLIALIVHLIKKKTEKEEFNKYGEQIKTTIETNIRILPKSTYTLYDVPLLVVYDDRYIVDYAYVEITVNGKEQYLFHENYYSIVAEHAKLLDKEKADFEKNKEQPLKTSIGFMGFTGIIGVLLISVFIVDKRKAQV